MTPNWMAKKGNIPVKYSQAVHKRMTKVQTIQRSYITVELNSHETMLSHRFSTFRCHSLGRGKRLRRRCGG